MGPQACRIRWTYWDRLRMVMRLGGYCGKLFKGFREATQGDPLPPTIFNVVVDTVVQNWIEEMVESADGQGGRGREGRNQNPLFYADDGMIALSDPGWLQGALSTLVGLFDWVGMRKNVGKTVGMVCRLCQAVGTYSEAAYKWRMTGAGLSYWERQ